MKYEIQNRRRVEPFISFLLLYYHYLASQIHMKRKIYPVSPSCPLSTVSFYAADERFVIAGTVDGRLVKCNVHSGECIQVFVGGIQRLHCTTGHFTFCTDGAEIVVMGGQDGLLRAWNGPFATLGTNDLTALQEQVFFFFLVR